MNQTTKLTIITLLTLTTSATRAAAQHPPFIDHNDYDRILRTHVRAAGIDYLMLRKNDYHPLRTYLDTIDYLDPNALAAQPGPEQLALYLNLYNATMIRLVVERFHAHYRVSENGFGVFKENHVALAGRRLSLDQLAHDLIRVPFQDPRIHAAIVCASHGCTPLYHRAYTADNVHATLDHVMRRFLNDPTRNRIDLKKPPPAPLQNLPMVPRRLRRPRRPHHLRQPLQRNRRH